MRRKYFLATNRFGQSSNLLSHFEVLVGEGQVPSLQGHGAQLTVVAADSIPATQQNGRFIFTIV